MLSLIALTSLLALAAAAPVSETPTKRGACGYAYPSLITAIDSLDPNQRFGAGSYLQAGAFGPSGPFRAAAVQFEVPAGSWGCQLEYNFPQSAVVTTSGRSALSVYKPAPKPNHPGTDFTALDTWNNSPAIGSGFGFFNPAPGSAGVIGSEGCRATLGYYFTTAENWQINSKSAEQGSFLAEQISDPAAFQGVRVRYNC